MPADNNIDHSPQEIIDFYHYTEIRERGYKTGVLKGYYVDSAFRFIQSKGLPSRERCTYFGVRPLRPHMPRKAYLHRPCLVSFLSQYLE